MRVTVIVRLRVTVMVRLGVTVMVRLRVTVMVRINGAGLGTTCWRWALRLYLESLGDGAILASVGHDAAAVVQVIAPLYQAMHIICVSNGTAST